MQPDDIKFSRQIFDNVHGFIGVTELESKVIASPFFQRLRRIKQLSLLEYVFPGASHNRFSHSLGVMHIADSMVVQLQQNAGQEGILENKRKLIRMAALLHDVGHYPLSHLVESVVQEDAKAKFKNQGLVIEENGVDDLSSNDGGISRNFSFLDDNKVHKLNCSLHTSRNDSGDYAHHERMGGIVIHNTPLHEILLGDETFNEEDIRSISQIIAGSYPGGGPEYVIIHSELDADRFDYLLRDSKHTGVTYGIFDMNQIIRNLKYDDKEGKLVVDEKARKAVEHYLMCKYFFYNTVINHKATVGFEIIAKKVYEGLMERGIGKSYFDLLEIFNDKDRVEQYLDYDDSYFFNTIKDVYNKKIKFNPIDNPKIPDKFLFELIEKILKRDPLKMVFEESRLTTKGKQLDSRFLDSLFEDRVRSTGKIENYWFIPFTKSEALTKISPHKSFGDKADSPEIIDETIKILSKNKDGSGEEGIVVLIQDNTSIMSILGDYNLQIERLYTKNDLYKQIIEEEYDKIKRKKKL